MDKYVGQKYGRLTIVGERIIKNKHPYYLCKCECGNIKEIRLDHLRSGATVSCGCLHKEKVSNNFEDITNRTFGEWTVLKRVERPEKANNKGTYWLCRCSCGTERIVWGNSLRGGASKSCGCIKSHGEEKISKILSENAFSFSKEFSFSDCLSINNYPLRFDFAIFEKQQLLCLIEFQGKQHYEDNNWNWISPKENDKIKREYCLNNKIKLVEIPYWDYEKINLEHLKEKIYG